MFTRKNKIILYWSFGRLVLVPPAEIQFRHMGPGHYELFTESWISIGIIFQKKSRTFIKGLSFYSAIKKILLVALWAHGLITWVPFAEKISYVILGVFFYCFAFLVLSKENEDLINERIKELIKRNDFVIK